MVQSPWIRSILCVLLVALTIGATKKVVLKSGGSYEGEVTETETGYLVETRYGPITLTRDQVDRVEDPAKGGSKQSEYERRLAKINLNSASDHYQLGKWAFDEGEYALARKELEQALKIDENYELATLLLRRVDAAAPGLSEEMIPDATTQATTSPKSDLGIANFNNDWLVTEEEMSRIRLEELTDQDRVVIEFRNDVINHFIEIMKGRDEFAQPNFDRTFRTWPPIRKARYILSKVDRNDVDIKNDIFVKTDPDFMLKFRTQIFPMVYSYCDFSKYEPNGLRLFRSRLKSPNLDYTNFLILDSYTRDGQKMINREHVDDSLLLQYGLPEKIAKYPNPYKITPAFRNQSDPRYRRVRDWIESLQGPPAPDYRVTLRVPWATARTDQKSALESLLDQDKKAEPPVEEPAPPAAPR